MNKLNLVLGSLLLSSSSMSAVNGNVEKSLLVMSDTVTVDSVKENQDKGEVYHVVEQMPEYPGGMNAMMSYLATNIRYPEDAHKAKKQGRVIVEFVIDQEGKPCEFEVKRKVYPSLDAEAVRVIKSMPRWKPGVQRGKPVRVRYTIPVSFRLPKETSANVPTGLIVPIGPPVEDSGEGEIFRVVETMPEFPGGMEALLNYVKSNIKYPEDARNAKIEGRVVVEFFVDQEGNPCEFEVKRKVHSSLDSEAIRVLNSMPKWKPGMQRGRPVRTRYTVSIAYFLSDSVKVEIFLGTSEVWERQVQGEIFQVVEQMPEFPGGMAAMMNYLAENIQYPTDANAAGIQGRVIAEFVVDKEGWICDVNLTKKVFPSLDAEAMRIIKNMPQWKPGMQRGKAVNVRYTIPILFSLPKSEPK